MICPKCGYEQTQADECIRCGVIISNLTSIQKRKNLEEEGDPSVGCIRVKAENTSGQGRSSIVPPEVIGWSWGAFFLNFIWAIGNRTWIGLLSLLPVVCYVMPIILGIKGNEWAWKNKHWDSIDHFKQVQKKWSRWGTGLCISVMVVFYSFFYMAFQTGKPITGKHVSSVDWLPPGATDINYYKVDGFAWILDYDCSIPEDDFLELAERKGWKLQDNGDLLFYEKRHSNGGGVTVHFDKYAKRLSVRSNHH